MGFLWFIIGAVIGFLVAWFLRGQQCRSELSDREAEIGRLRSDLDAANEKAAAAPAASRDVAETAQPAAEPPSANTVNDNRSPPQAASEPNTLLDAPNLNVEPDDLTRIKGIGQVLQTRLNALGIVTFRQIADFTPADITRVNEELDFPGRIERERWVEQARTFAE